MRIVYVWICLTFFGGMIHAQDVHFRLGDKKRVVLRGDLVHIETDTAYVISASMAQQLNAKLFELKESRIANERLAGANQKLLSKFKEVEILVGKLLKKMEMNGEEISANLANIMNQLDVSIVALKKNNQQLERNNAGLNGEIKAMQSTIQLLKKEIRGVWWSGITDKIVVGAAGVGVGILIMLL